jgi:hypothetical protein
LRQSDFAGFGAANLLTIVKRAVTIPWNKGPKGMRVSYRLLVVIVFCGGVLPARAGVSLSSYDTQVQANAYAPPDQSAYYSDNSKHNTSPASGDINADWSGTNVGGSDTTWHMTALVNANSTTTTTPNSLAIAGAGSFAYEITTTAGFSEPLKHATLFTPGANCGVGSVFTIDQPATYSISVLLNGDSSVSLASFSDGFLLNQGHIGSLPKLVTMEGVLSSGKYQVGVTANTGRRKGDTHLLLTFLRQDVKSCPCLESPESPVAGLFSMF